MSRGFISRPRFYALVVAVVLAFGAVLARLAYLQIFGREQFYKTVEEIRENFIVLHARRGDIVDRCGRFLATTRASVIVGVDPQMTRQEELGQLPELAKLLKQRAEVVEAAFALKDTKVRWKKLAESVDDITYEAILKLKIHGVYGQRVYDRVYPSGSLAAHVLGFVNKESTPSGGIEQRMDFYLCGHDGWIETEKDGRRRELAAFRRREVPATHGGTVELTLDSGVQQAVEESIQRIVATYKPTSVTAIVSEAKTGYILALANWPTFDPNKFWQAPMDALRDRSITDVFEPGSTFKIVVASAVLNENLVTPETRFDCAKNVIEYKGKQLSLPHDWHSMAVLSVKEIVAQSSNRGMANLGVILGPEKIYQYALAYGFGQKTGYGMPGEVVGIVHPPSHWDDLTITRMPMGHAMCATALQVHTGMSVIANKGILVLPQVVKNIYDADGTTLLTFQPNVKRRVIKEETARLMTDFIEKNALKIKNGSILVAGKTGTSQKIINGQYSHTQHISSFSGFFPKDNPKVIVTLVIDNPKVSGIAYGAVYAAPQFLKLAEELAPYLNILSND